MKKYTVLSLLAALLFPISLAAQSELEEKLKAVMLLFDKNQKSAYAEIDSLSATNEDLTTANLKLYNELDLAQKKLQDLEEEVLLLRAKISDVAVRQFEAASLTPSTNPDRRASPQNNPGRRAASTNNSVTDFTPQAYRDINSDNPPLASGLTTTADGKIQININTATEEELTQLPEVPLWLAKRIIQGRPYNSVWELMKEQAFGRKKMDAVIPYVVVE